MLIIGSGAGGMAAAVTAAAQGLKVVVLEKEASFGGAAAWSGGWMWLPGNRFATDAGFHDAPEGPMTYLRHELGNHFDEKRVAAFLQAVPDAVDFFQRKTALQFVEGNGIPDMHGNTPGAATGGHQLCAAPINGRKLGPLFSKLRRPMPETAFLGMPIMAGADLAAFMNVTRSAKAFFHVAKRLGRHLLDLALLGRATQLVNGNALMARLGLSASNFGVELRLSCVVKHLTFENGAVTGAVFEEAGKTINIVAKSGTVLATGGFAHDKSRWRELCGDTPIGTTHYSTVPPSVSGDGLRLGEAVGAKFDGSLASQAAWAPVSLVPHKDGSFGRFPHIIERAKPGLIAVLPSGKRFVNEANGYYDYVTAMIRETPPNQQVVSWLICTKAFQRRYGFGISRPSPLPVAPFIKSGYIKVGRSIAELAQVCGIDEATLQQTLHSYNEGAKIGEDPAFGKGSTPFNRKGGDATVSPNPCLAPIETGPFYAIQVVPGSFGTFMGLSTDEHTRALDAEGEAIPKLFAVGADMASIMGGFYPSGGINLGPALTFGYIAGMFMAKSAGK